MVRKERRRIPRGGSSRGAVLRREIAQLKRESQEILLHMDELLKELERLEAVSPVLSRPKK
jgi:hypothetical protein